VHFHHTPTPASWVNMIECFFSILGKQGLSQSVHTSKRQLKEFLLNYIVQNNKNPKPFAWTQEYQAAHPRKLRKRRRKAHSIKN